MNHSKSVVATLVAAAAVVIPTASAEAGLALRLSSTHGGSVTVMDQEVGVDQSTQEGVTSYIGSIGYFNLNITVGTSKPVIGSDEKPKMGMVSINGYNHMPDTLLIELSDTDFVGPMPYGEFETRLNGTLIAGSVNLQSFVDTSNTLFGEGTQVADISLAGPGDTTASADVGTAPAPYSLTMKATIDHGGSTGVAQFDAAVYVIPEPSSLALFAAGLLPLALAQRRRRSKKKTDPSFD